MKLASRGVCRQFLAGYMACLLSFSYGLNLGWLSPVQVFLQSDQSPVGKLSDEDISWMASILFLGSMFGTLFFSPIIRYFGRRTMLYILGVPYLLSAVCIYFSNSLLLMLVARFLAGMCFPGTVSTVALYISEISDQSVRGNLGSSSIFFCNFGIMVMFVSANGLSYYPYTLLTVIIAAVGIITFWIVPESPVYYIRTDQVDKAKKVLSWLRDTKNEILLNDEVEKLQMMFFDQSSVASKKSLTWREVFATKYYWKSFLLGFTLQAGVSTSGIPAFQSFAYTIFAECMEDPNPGKYAAFFLLILIVGSALSLFLTNTFPRKTMVVGTRLLCALANFFIGLLLVLRDVYHFPIHNNYFTASFILYYVFFGLGLSSIVYILFSELFSVECRDKFMQALLLIHSALYFSFVKLYPMFLASIHLYSWLFIYTILSLVLAFILIVFLPETTDKTVVEIAQEITRGSKCNEGRQQANVHTPGIINAGFTK